MARPMPLEPPVTRAAGDPSRASGVARAPGGWYGASESVRAVPGDGRTVHGRSRASRRSTVEQSIRIQTEIPGPISRAWIARKEAVVANAKTLVVPIFVRARLGRDADGRRRQHLPRLRGRHRLPHGRALERRRSRSACTRRSTASCTPTSRSSPTTRTSSWPSARPPACRSAGRSRRRSSTRAPRRSRTPSRSRAPQRAGRPSSAFTNAFHGRTLMALDADVEDPPVQGRVRAVRARGVPRAVPDEYHWTGDDAAGEALDELRLAFRTTVDPSQVACIVIEPVQGEGGFVPRRRPTCAACASSATSTASCSSPTRCRPASAARASFFAIEQSGVEPDLVCVAKSIAAGLPLSGVLGRASIMDAPGDSAIGGTYVGNPVACAAALAVLDEIDGLRPVRPRPRHRRDDAAAPRRPAGARSRRSGTCAASARCWASSSCVTRHARARHPARDPHGRARAAARPDPAAGRPARQRDPQPGAADPDRRRAGRGARRCSRVRSSRRPQWSATA